MGNQLSHKQKMRIFRRDGWKCQYCGVDASSDFEIFYLANLNIDHMNPKGGDDDSNLVTACRQCNLNKRAHPFESFAEAKDFVLKKKAQNYEWFKKNVLTS